MTEPVYQSYAQMYRETDYAAFAQEHHSGGSLGVDLFVAHQGPMEMEDPPNAQVGFVSVLRAEGPMEVALNGPWDAQPLREGLFLHPARQAAGFRTRHPHTILVAGVDQARLTALLDEAGVRADPFGPLYARNEPLPEVMRLMRRIWVATAAAGPAANLLVDGLFGQALSLVLRACDPGWLPPPPPELADRRLARVVEYVEAHLGEPMTVVDLARAAAMSPSSFGRAFRAATGEAPWAFVQRRRLERARRMLLTTSEPVTAIAHACGFAHPGHLATAFRAAYGVTPSEARRAAETSDAGLGAPGPDAEASRGGA